MTAGLVALLLLSAACGSDDDDGDASPATTTGTTAPLEGVSTADVEGCDSALSDIVTISATDPPGSCDEGSPAPVPLEEPATIQLGMSNISIEVFASAVVALHAEEFERENLTVELNIVPSTDAIQLLADGQLDVVVSAPTAGFFNGLAQGFDMRWVAGQVRQPPDLESGLWVRSGLTVADLPGMTVASTVGRGSNAFLSLYDEAQEVGIDISEIDIQQIASVQDVVTALLNGGVDAGYVSPPFFTQLEEAGGFDYLLPQNTIGEAVGGILFGPRLLEERSLGEAFLRAYVRTISTSFQGDYESDPETVELMAAALEVPPDVITGTAAYIADYEIHRSTVDRLQGLYFATDAVSYGESEALGDADVVDRGFLEAAVGQEYEPPTASETPG